MPSSPALPSCPLCNGPASYATIWGMRSSECDDCGFSAREHHWLALPRCSEEAEAIAAELESFDSLYSGDLMEFAARIRSLAAPSVEDELTAKELAYLECLAGVLDRANLPVEASQLRARTVSRYAAPAPQEGKLVEALERLMVEVLCERDENEDARRLPSMDRAYDLARAALAASRGDQA